MPVQNLSWAIKSISTQSVLNPLLWVAGITLTTFVALAIGRPEVLGWAVTTVLLAPVPVALVSYIGVLIYAPDRLHSEKHQLALHKMGMMGDSVSGRIQNRSIELSRNPTRIGEADE